MRFPAPLLPRCALLLAILACLPFAGALAGPLPLGAHHATGELDHLFDAAYVCTVQADVTLHPAEAPGLLDTRLRWEVQLVLPEEDPIFTECYPIWSRPMQVDGSAESGFQGYEALPCGWEALHVAPVQKQTPFRFVRREEGCGSTSTIELAGLLSFDLSFDAPLEA